MANLPPALTEEDRANLVAYLDGELESPAARALEAKLSNDPRARAEADALRRTWQLLDYLPQPEVSPSFTHQTLSRVTAQQPSFRLKTAGRPRPWLLGVGWAAAVLVAGAVGYAGGSFLPHRKAKPVESQADADQNLIQDLRVIDNLRLYEHIDDLPFLEGLADPKDPDLFGDDNFDL